MGCQYFSPHPDDAAATLTVMMPKLSFGRGCLAELGRRAAGRGLRRVALFTDPYLASGPLVDRALRSLHTAGVEAASFSGVRIEPDQSCVEDGARFYADGNFDGVVSVGGGSVLDTAKAALVYACYPDDFLAYFGPPVGAGKAIPGPLPPHIACPTTSGTGSECTGLSVLRVDGLDTKFVIASPWLLPDEALVDPACCDSLPANVVASTGFDLLSHALECYTARAYTRWPQAQDPAARPQIQGANPWSDLAAREALSLVGRYLTRGVADADDSEARDRLMWAATLAGMAFGNSGTHLPHAMSYGVTHLMRDVTTADYAEPSPFVPHGLSVIVCAPAVFRFTAPGAPERHLEAAAYLGAGDKDITDAAAADAGEVVAARLIELMRATGAPNGLGALGFGDGDVKPLTESSARQRRAIGNAPREVHDGDIAEIYAGALRYW